MSSSLHTDMSTKGKQSVIQRQTTLSSRGEAEGSHALNIHIDNIYLVLKQPWAAPHASGEQRTHGTALAAVKTEFLRLGGDIQKQIYNETLSRGTWVALYVYSF